jgi:hypothetical protein
VPISDDLESVFIEGCGEIPLAWPPAAQPAVQKDKRVGTVVDSGYGYKVIGFAPGTLTDIPVGTRCFVAAPEKGGTQ